MKCTTCENWSFFIICKQCQKNLLRPHIKKRILDNDFNVYSFYDFDEIEELISSKYYFHGDKIFNILAKNSFAAFARQFSFNKKVIALSIDDHTRHNFSHTAILSKHLKSSYITPKYNQLKASNIVKYAGKDLNFREQNPRKFKLNEIKNETVILIDDLITTGTTLKEAKKVCEKNNNQVLFALTLANARA